MSIPTILHASVLLPASEWGPGLPVLSMRRPWRWARNLVERAGGIWMPDSAPSKVVLPTDDCGSDWWAFEVEYRAEMLARPWVLDELLRRGAADPRRGLVLLCWEPERKDGTLQCHRVVLADLLRERRDGRVWEGDGGMPGKRSDP